MPKLYYDQDGKARKFCPACKTEFDKPEENFTKNSSEPDGLFHYCKLGKVAYEKDRRVANPERSRAYSKQQGTNWRKNNLEKNREYHREYEKRPEQKEKRQPYDLARKHTPEYRAINNASSRRVYARNPHKFIEQTMRRRAIKKETAADSVDYSLVLREYGYICHICGKIIDMTAKRKSNLSLSFDHVIPLQPRKGEPQGTHTYDNIKPAHYGCNVRKGNKPLETLTAYERRGPD